MADSTPEATTPSRGLPGTGPIHWSHAVNIPEGAAPDAAGLAGYFAAQALAHSQAYHQAVRAMVNSGEPGEEPPEAAEAFRAASWRHLPVMAAAFAAAALLKGWEPEDIWEVVTDGADVFDECAWDWMFAVLDLPEEQQQSFWERLTTDPPPLKTEPEAQHALEVPPAEPARPAPDGMSTSAKVIEGLTIFARYENSDNVHAEHDTLFAGPDGPVSPEDLARLETLGWHEDPEGGYSIFI